MNAGISSVNNDATETGREESVGEQPLTRLGSAGEIEATGREARTWRLRAEEHARARAQIARRMQAARRDVYDANLRAEEAETRAGQAMEAAREAETRAQTAEAAGRSSIDLANALARHAEQERDAMEQERDAILYSTTWRATWPLRAVGSRLPSAIRQALRTGAQMGWWAITFKLSHKLRERHQHQRTRKG